MRMRAYFVAGVDTGVGKTHVICALLRDLVQRGEAAMGCKPVACGDRKEPRAMREAAASPALSLELVNPVFLRTAADPRVGGDFEHVALSVTSLVEKCQPVFQQYDTVLVEGTGGWETPLCPGATMADFARALGLPVLLVVSNRQGAVSQALLTLRAIRGCGLECRGIILNQLNEEWDSAAVTNRSMLEEYTGVPVLAELIQGEDMLDSDAVLV